MIDAAYRCREKDSRGLCVSLRPEAETGGKVGK